MASWQLLEDRAEAELHKIRLLNVEEKPFKRITKRLIALSSTVPGASPGADGRSALYDSQLLQVDLTHDFAALDSSIARFQLLHDANERERERYAVDGERILAEYQSVRESNGRLHEQLESARSTLVQRKKFDDLADKITSNRLLRPRDDQRANLAKLEDECRQLGRESEAYAETWRERRAQFNRIMDEGMMLRRLIRDEKGEVDRREGMDEGAEDADAEKDAQTPRVLPSEHATPHADVDSQPKAVESALQTPRHASPGSGSPKAKSRSSLSKDFSLFVQAHEAAAQAVEITAPDDMDVDGGGRPSGETRGRAQQQENDDADDGMELDN